MFSLDALSTDETDEKNDGDDDARRPHSFLFTLLSLSNSQVKQAIHVAAQPADGSARNPDDSEQQENMDSKRTEDTGGDQLTDEQLRAVFRATSCW